MCEKLASNENDNNIDILFAYGFTYSYIILIIFKLIYLTNNTLKGTTTWGQNLNKINGNNVFHYVIEDDTALVKIVLDEKKKKELT